MRNVSRLNVLRRLRWIHASSMPSTSNSGLPIICSTAMYSEKKLKRKKSWLDQPGFDFYRENLELEEAIKKAKEQKTRKNVRTVPSTFLAPLPIEPTNQLLKYSDYKEFSKIDNPVWRQLRPQPEDLELIQSNVFESSYSMETLLKDLPNQISAEFSYAEGTSRVFNNQRISGPFFMFNVLLPIERQIDSFISVVAKSQDVYLPAFIQWCGIALSDLETKNRIRLVQRLIKAIQSNGFAISLPLLNSLMTVYIQNDYDFDPHKVLDMAELELKLEVNQEFFNNLVWQMGNQKEMSVNTYENIRFEMGKRNLFPDLHTIRGYVHGLAKVGELEKMKTVIKDAPKRFGPSGKRQLIGAGLIGLSASEQTLDQLKTFLSDSIIDSTDKKAQGKYRLNADIADIIIVVWKLAKISEDGLGEEHSALVRKILRYVPPEHGQFKLIIREIHRHLVHDYYYTALALLDYQLSAVSKSSAIKDGAIMKHIRRRFARQAVCNALPPNLVFDISNKLAKVFGEKNGLCYDDLAYAILNFKGYGDIMKRYKVFESHIDAIDPERERPQLILPFLAKIEASKSNLSSIDEASKVTIFESKTPSINEASKKADNLKGVYKEAFKKKLLMLYLFTTSLNYKNLAYSDPRLLFEWIVQPIIRSIKLKDVTKEGRGLLDVVNSKLLSYGMAKPDLIDLWKKLIKYYNIKLIPSTCIEAWINENEVDDSFGSPPTDENFKNAISTRDIGKIHEMLTKYNFLSEANIQEIIEPLMNLYIESASLSYMQKLLDIISKINLKSVSKYELGFQNPINFHSSKPLEDLSTVSPLQTHHLLKVFLKRFNEMPECSVQNLIDYAQEVKELFPHALNDNPTETTKAYRDLFKILIKSNKEKKEAREHVQKCAELLELLFRHQVVYLNLDETLTPYFINIVINIFGLDLAIDIWIQIQKNLYCSNALVPLLEFSLKNGLTGQVEFLLHHASKTMGPQKLNAYYAAILVNMNKIPEAKTLFQHQAAINETPKAGHCTAIFSIMLNLLYDNQAKSYFAKEFLKLILEHTDFKEDKAAQKQIHHSWIRAFGQSNEAMSALSIYEILRENGVALDEYQMNELGEILKPHKELNDRWIFNAETSLLNSTSSETDQEKVDFENRFQLFESDLKRVEETPKQINLSDMPKVAHKRRSFKN